MRTVTRQMRRKLAAENRTWPDTLVRVPEYLLPRGDSQVPVHRQPIEVWRSRQYLIQVFNERDGIERLSIQSTTHNGSRFVDGISWDILQRLKSECGRGDKDAVEIYPAESEVVNVANIRHLWVYPGQFPLTWRNR